MNERRINFAKEGKLEFFQNEMLGKAGAQYRTALDQDVNVHKTGNINVDGALLNSANNLELQNKLDLQSKFAFYLI